MTTPTPSVPNFVAGFGPQQSDMQSLWVNALAFFQQRMVFRATQATTATTLPSGGGITKIAYDNIIEDPYSGWSAANHQWTPPAGLSGWFQVTVTVWVAAPGALQIALQVYVNTTGAASNLANGLQMASVVLPSTAAGSAEGTWYPYLVGGQDAVYGAASLEGSAVNVTTNLTAGQNSSIEVLWIAG